MNTISFKLLPLAIAFSVSSGSFAQTPTHQDQLVYYTTIAKQVKELTPKVQGLWGQIETAIIGTAKTQIHQLDNDKISVLRSASSDNINDLDRAIRTINALEEADSSMSLKQTVLRFLNDIKAAEQAAMPGITTVLARGTDKMTPQETSNMKLFLSRGEELRSRQRMITNVFATYRSRYNITPDDLYKFGL